MSEDLRQDIVQQLSHLDTADLSALYLILTERIGQIEREGWTLTHDAKHKEGTLALAAAAYAKVASDEIQGLPEIRCPYWWPWSKKWWKPKGFQRNLERSGALIMAEISRMLRA